MSIKKSQKELIFFILYCVSILFLLISLRTSDVNHAFWAMLALICAAIAAISSAIKYILQKRS